MTIPQGNVAAAAAAAAAAVVSIQICG